MNFFGFWQVHMLLRPSLTQCAPPTIGHTSNHVIFSQILIYGTAQAPPHPKLCTVTTDPHLRIANHTNKKAKQHHTIPTDEVHSKATPPIALGFANHSKSFSVL